MGNKSSLCACKISIPSLSNKSSDIYWDTNNKSTLTCWIGNLSLLFSGSLLQFDVAHVHDATANPVHVHPFFVIETQDTGSFLHREETILETIEAKRDVKFEHIVESC